MFGRANQLTGFYMMGTLVVKGSYGVLRYNMKARTIIKDYLNEEQRLLDDFGIIKSAFAVVLRHLNFKQKQNQIKN